MVITWCQVRTIRWMHNNLPTKLPELLASRCRCVWHGVVLMKHNSCPSGQSWPLLGDCFLQTVQLFTVQVRIKSLAAGEQLIVSNSLPISPNAQQDLPGRQSWLDHRLRRLTALQSLPFLLDVVVSDPLFIASHYLLQKWVDFVAIQQRFTDGNSVHEVFCVNSCGTHTSSFFVSSLFQMVPNGFLCNV